MALCLNAGAMGRIDAESETLIPIGGSFDVPDVAPCLTGNYGKQPDSSDTNAGPMLVPFTLAIRGRGDSHDLEYRQDGIANAVLTPNGGRGGIGVGAIAFAHQTAGDRTTTMPIGEGFSPTLKAGPSMAVAFDARQSDVLQYGEKSGPLDTDGNSIGIHVGMSVRRLTPRECERLQGFPDDYTRIPQRVYKQRRVTKTRPNDRWERNSDGSWTLMAADGPRYKALGNSMAVPVMAWIGRRIQMVATLEREGVL